MWEPLKAGWHAGLLVLAAGACLYNLAALGTRGKRHLFLNCLLYGALVAVEARQVAQHTHGPDA